LFCICDLENLFYIKKTITMAKLNLLNNTDFIKWCYWKLTKWTILDKKNKSTELIMKESKEFEREWWNSLSKQVGNWNWTTVLCESAVEEILTKLWYKNVRNSRKLKSTTSEKTYNPDFECDDFVWEVKWSNWTITWTAWEKILWTPLKYSEIPRLYWKPLRIVCVWYQEWEAKNWFACGNLINPEERGTEELAKMLLLFKKLKIEYVGFTDLLEKLKNKK